MNAKKSAKATKVKATKRAKTAKASGQMPAYDEATSPAGWCAPDPTAKPEPTDEAPGKRRQKAKAESPDSTPTASKPAEQSAATDKPAPAATKPAEQSDAMAKPDATPAAKDKPAKATATKAGGLRGPQIRILAALKKAGKELTRKEISEKAPVDNAFCTEYLGASDPARRARNDAKFPSLLTLKFIKAETEGTVATYTITAAGIKALETAKAE